MFDVTEQTHIASSEVAAKGNFLVNASLKSIPSEKNEDMSNEDAAFTLTLPTRGIFVAGVFDGMGGLANGKEASRIANGFVKSKFQLSYKKDRPSEEHIKEHIREALTGADSAVHKAAELQGNDMGTTGDVVCVFTSPSGERKAVIGHIGDSRVYLWRHGILTLYTIDDNLVSFGRDKNEARSLQKKLDETVDPRQLSALEQQLYEQRAGITKALGLGEMEPQLLVLRLEPGDKLFMCSDGISDNLTLTELNQIFSKNKSIQDTTNHIIENAVKRSRDRTHPRAKPDDMTALVLDPFTQLINN